MSKELKPIKTAYNTHNRTILIRNNRCVRFIDLFDIESVYWFIRLVCINIEHFDLCGTSERKNNTHTHTQCEEHAKCEFIPSENAVPKKKRLQKKRGSCPLAPSSSVPQLCTPQSTTMRVPCCTRHASAKAFAAITEQFTTVLHCTETKKRKNAQRTRKKNWNKNGWKKGNECIEVLYIEWREKYISVLLLGIDCVEPEGVQVPHETHISSCKISRWHENPRARSGTQSHDDWVIVCRQITPSCHAK